MSASVEQSSIFMSDSLKKINKKVHTVYLPVFGLTSIR
jgi:tryptophanyl-tRNA synthetase